MKDQAPTNLLEINGHLINLIDQGGSERPVAVLLHHGLGSVRAWREQLPALAAAGWRVIAYDRWGYGGSAARAGIDMPTFTQDLADLTCLLDSLQVDKATLVGHSDGGTIALAYAAVNPKRVSALVTVAAHVYIEPKMISGILEVWESFQHDPRMRHGLRRVHGEKYEQTFHNWFDGWRGCDCAAWDLRPRLGDIRCPVLVVQGMEDEHATPQHAIDTAAAIPGAQLWLVPGASHMLPQENAELFNPRLLAFLRQAG